MNENKFGGVGAATAWLPGFAFSMETIPCLGSLTSLARTTRSVTPIYKLQLRLTMTMSMTNMTEYDYGRCYDGYNSDELNHNDGYHNDNYINDEYHNNGCDENMQTQTVVV